MKSSAVLNSRHERTAGSMSQFGSSNAVSGNSAILVRGSSRVAIVKLSLTSPDANHTVLHAASQHGQAATRVNSIGSPFGRTHPAELFLGAWMEQIPRCI